MRATHARYHGVLGQGQSLETPNGEPSGGKEGPKRWQARPHNRTSRSSCPTPSGCGPWRGASWRTPLPPTISCKRRGSPRSGTRPTRRGGQAVARGRVAQPRPTARQDGGPPYVAPESRGEERRAAFDRGVDRARRHGPPTDRDGARAARAVPHDRAPPLSARPVRGGDRAPPGPARRHRAVAPEARPRRATRTPRRTVSRSCVVVRRARRARAHGWIQRRRRTRVRIVARGCARGRRRSRRRRCAPVVAPARCGGREGRLRAAVDRGTSGRRSGSRAAGATRRPRLGPARGDRARRRAGGRAGATGARAQPEPAARGASGRSP